MMIDSSKNGSWIIPFKKFSSLSQVKACDNLLNKQINFEHFIL